MNLGRGPDVGESNVRMTVPVAQLSSKDFDEYQSDCKPSAENFKC